LSQQSQLLRRGGSTRDDLDRHRAERVAEPTSGTVGCSASGPVTGRVGEPFRQPLGELVAQPPTWRVVAAAATPSATSPTDLLTLALAEPLARPAEAVGIADLTAPPIAWLTQLTQLAQSLGRPVVAVAAPPIHRSALRVALPVAQPVAQPVVPVAAQPLNPPPVA
jgi:hypothetical protein